MHRRPLLLRWLILLLPFLAAHGAHAQLLAYEGFQYPPVGQTLSLWPVTNKTPDGKPLKYFAEIDTHAFRSPYDYTIQIVQGSIPTGGSAFPFEAQGNALSWSGDWLDAYATLEPAYQFDTSRDNTPIYVSFLLRANKSPNPLRQISLAFSNGGNMRLQVGVDDSGNTGSPRFFATAANPQPSQEFARGVTFQYDKTYFLVARIECRQNAPDLVHLAVFPPGSTVPRKDAQVTWQATARDWTDYLVDTVSISVWGGDSGKVLFDELRIGRSWESVAAGQVSAVTAAANVKPASAAGETSEPAETVPAAEGEAADGPGSGSIIGLLVLLVLVGFGVGGGAYYMLVLKPGKAAPKAPPPQPGKPAPPTGDVADDGPEEDGPAKPQFRQPKKPMPPKPR